MVTTDLEADEETVEGVILSDATVRLLSLLLSTRAVDAKSSSSASKEKAEKVMLTREV